MLFSICSTRFLTSISLPQQVNFLEISFGVKKKNWSLHADYHFGRLSTLPPWRNQATKLNPLFTSYFSFYYSMAWCFVFNTVLQRSLSFLARFETSLVIYLVGTAKQAHYSSLSLTGYVTPVIDILLCQRSLSFAASTINDK